MKNYEKPVVLSNEELVEGIYTASGDMVAENNTTAANAARPGCDSKYVNGVWHKDNYGSLRPGQKGRPSHRVYRRD